MPLRLFDFKCPNNHIEERFVQSDIREVKCSLCDKIAERIISPVATKLDGISGDFPGAAIKWARQHEKASKSKD